MKKVILGAAALLMCAAVNAQVTDTKGATSSNSTVVAAKAGAAVDANTGESIQNGDDNRVMVRQAGARMSVRTVQNNGSGTGGNLAQVWQTGEVMPGPSGLENAVEVLQSGSLNESTSIQEGNYNDALTRQGQNDDASSGNRALIRQGTGNQAENNFAGIDQDGTDNQAQTQQTYDNSDAWTQQVGNRNWSRINQNAGPNGSDGHLASVEQDGDDNASDVMQSGAGARNSATAVQVGNGNYAKQTQTTDAVQGGVGNSALANQGYGSISAPLIGSIWSGQLLAVDDVANGAFSGDGSFAGIAFQNQSGSENTAESHQFGADGVDGNYSEQNQGGSNNDAFVVQNAYGNPAGGANYARQDQDSNATNSEAGIAQNGFNHKAYQRQSGDDNNAMSTQRGNGNIVNTYQDGDSNRATTAQRGADNQILLVQRGGHSYGVTQNLPNGTPVGSPHAGNVVDVLQLGPDGDFSTDGIDCVIPDAMTPMDTPDMGNFTIDAPCDGC